MRFQKPPVLASLLAVSGIAVLCGLGTWQIQRLEEKEEFLTKLATWEQEEPAWLSFENFREDNLYKPGTLRGEWLGASSIRLIPRTYEGTPGSHIYTPLRLEDGRAVMVNRGWVPQGSEGPALPGGTAVIKGQIQNFPSPNMFTPDNPRSSRDWYRLNRKAAQGLIKSDIEMAPLILRATEGNMPNTEATAPQIPNDHAAYAAFWFWMAAVLAVIFFLRFIRKPA